MSVENKHWIESERNLFSFLWVSHLVVSPLVGPAFRPQQQRDYVAHLTRSAESGVKSLAIRFDETLPQWGLSLVFEAVDEEQALGINAMTALDALSVARVDIDDLEYVATHLAYHETLRRDSEAAAAHHQEHDITAQEYYVQDEDMARAAFLQARAFHSELATLLG